MFKEFSSALKQRIAQGRKTPQQDGSLSFEELHHFRGGGMVSDAEFALTEQTPKGGRMIIYLALGCTATLLIWAASNRVEEIARGEGKVIPAQTVQLVQSMDGGVLAELLTTEGAQVAKDQPIARIETVRADAQVGEMAKRLMALRVKARRLEAENRDQAVLTLDGELAAASPDLVARETSLFLARRQEQIAQRQAASDMIRQREQDIREAQARREATLSAIASLERELEMTRPLLKAGAVSDVELLRLERDLNRAKGDKASLEANLQKNQAALAEARQRAREVDQGIRTRVGQEFNDVNMEIGSLNESLKGFQDRVSKTVLRSPVSGVVKTIHTKSVGGVIQPGKEVAEIVPAGESLLVEARIQPRDIAYLRQGQSAKVRLSAYDFSIYGGLPGTLEHISADSTTDDKGNTYYIIRVRTQVPAGQSEEIGSKSKPILPGMQATVDVLTGERTVLTYLLKPIIKAKERAFTER